MRRIEDVLDFWFDSGSMPFAQVHYPFENANWFDNHSPGDFIVEYIGQTRGWFYMLHVLATRCSTGRPSATVLSHGIVLGSDGQKMSKSLRNYPDVYEVFDRDGSDAMRWFLMSSRSCAAAIWSSPRRASARRCGSSCCRCGARTTSSPSMPTRRRYDGALSGVGLPQRARPVPAGQDRRRSSADVARDLEDFDIAVACGQAPRLRRGAHQLVRATVARRVLGRRRGRVRHPVHRPRDGDAGRRAAAAADREEIWRGLTGGRSVHLEDWPRRRAGRRTARSSPAMDLMRDVARRALPAQGAGAARTPAACAASPSRTPDARALHGVRGDHRTR